MMCYNITMTVIITIMPGNKCRHDIVRYRTVTQ